MGIFLNPGNAAFQSALRSQIYVDKTRMIEYVNSVLDTEQRCICASRPRRFGKSITAGMLAAYYGKGCDSKEMFQDLKIANFPDFNIHLNQYDVIYADMNDFRHRMNPETGDIITAIDSVRLFHTEVIAELKTIFPKSVSEQDGNLPTVLARINHDYGNKFIIIIDEWDTIFREDKLDTAAQEAYLTLLRGLFKDANSKRFLLLAYITGILPIKKYGTQSALNGFDEFTMVMPEPLEEYIGFTENEVKKLYQEYRLDFDEAKRWYDGYLLGDTLHIYNPKSVVDSIRRKKIASYWTRTETYESLKNYINLNFNGLKDTVIQMLSGGRGKLNIDRFQNDMTSFQSKDDILTLLIHLGYLAYDSKTREVYIPNEEIRSEFRNAIEGAGWDAVIQAINSSDKLLQATWTNLP